ncbi:hypothetical protein IQ06DRAFT_349033 [Phaeosphaeriaceae sp. SRC1lsM3a]|nr:hypothetical protein IQ06DRAFT_349033 [Stagonospora sp. SRC1lsM3a]
MGRIAQLEAAAEDYQRQQEPPRMQALEATRVQAEDKCELGRAIAASIVTAQEAKEKGEIRQAMIQSRIEHEAAVRQRNEQDEMYQAIRQSQIDQEAAERKREEEGEAQRALYQSTLGFEEEEHQRADPPESGLVDHQLLVETRRFRGSVERSQEGPSKTRKPPAPRKKAVSSAVAEEILSEPDRVVRAASSKTRIPRVHLKNAVLSVMSEETLNSPVGVVGTPTPSPPVRYESQADQTLPDSDSSSGEPYGSAIQIMDDEYMDNGEPVGVNHFAGARQFDTAAGTEGLVMGHHQCG